MYVKGNNKNKTFKNKSCDKIDKCKCHYCGKIGHRVKQCFKWMADGCPPKPNTYTSKSNENVHMNIMTVNISNVEKNEIDWFVDNGATSHITNKSDFFEKFEYFSNSHTVTTDNGDAIQAIGKGIIKVEADVGGRKQLITLNDLWYVPTIKKKIFSVLAAHDVISNSTFISEATTCKMTVNDKVLLGSRHKQGGLYKLQLRTVKSAEITNLESQNMLPALSLKTGTSEQSSCKENS